MYAIQQEPETGRRLRLMAIGAALSLLGHGALLIGSSSLPRKRPEPAPNRVRMTVVHAPAQPAPAVEPPSTVQPEPMVKPNSAKPKPRPAPKPAPKPMPERSADAAPKAQPAPLVVGLTLSSTTHSGNGPRFGVGNTLMGTPDRTAAPVQAGPMVRGPSVESASHASSKHRTAATLRRSAPPHYPTQAKQDGVEGVVVLSITINPRGRVEDASVLRGLGAGLDESALTAARNTLWSPATIDGEPVRSTRRFNVRFTLQI